MKAVIIVMYAACLFQIGMTTITSIHHNPPHIKIHRTETRDKIPYFDDNDGAGGNGSSIAVMRGENAYLVCIVRNLGNNSISWLRHSNINLLSVGEFKYTQDPRYQIFHNSQNDTWTLKIGRVQKDDEDWYECQFGISTSQPIGRMIYLKVIDPKLSIVEGEEKFIEVGSNLNLTCIIRQAAVLLEEENLESFSLKWTHNDQEINHTSLRGVFIVTEHNNITTISHLMIKDLTVADSGRYACSRALDENYYASIFVHVLHITNGDESNTLLYIRGIGQRNSSLAISLLILEIFFLLSQISAVLDHAERRKYS